MKIRPLADRILVKREEPAETVQGGIIIPDSAKEKPQEGRVVAAGPGRLDEDGKRVIIIGPEDPAARADPPDVDGDEDEGRSWSERRASRHDRMYRRGKIEVIDVLLDYGDTMTSLDKGQWIAFVVKLVRADYFERNKISHLVLKAKIDDLRAYAADEISEKEMITRIVELEY